MIKTGSPDELKENIDQIISAINTYSNQDISDLIKTVEKSFVLLDDDTQKFKKEFSSTLDTKYIDQIIDLTLVKSYLLKLQRIASKRITS